MTDATTKTPIAGPSSVWREHRLALLAAAVAGAIAGAILLFYALTATGDEAPIRVKNGSMELHLLTNKQTWQDTGNHWKVSGGTRAHPNYHVITTVNAGANCSSTLSGSGNPVVLTYSDNKSVTLDAVGNHTKVTSDATLSLSLDQRTLVYDPGSGFISRITVGGNQLCSFTAGNQLNELVLLDY